MGGIGSGSETVCVGSVTENSNDCGFFEIDDVEEDVDEEAEVGFGLLGAVLLLLLLLLFGLSLCGG